MNHFRRWFGDANKITKMSREMLGGTLYTTTYTLDNGKQFVIVETVLISFGGIAFYRGSVHFDVIWKYVNELLEIK